jgi:hypothetical protein
MTTRSRSVILSGYPAAGASPRVSVKVFLGDGSTALFAVGEAYQACTTDVTIDGLRIDRKIAGINDGTGCPDTYEYEEIDPTAGEIAFPKYAPPSGAVLSIHYLRAV